MWTELKRVIKPNGVIVLFGQEPFSSYLRLSNIEWYKYDLIYQKTRPSNPSLAKKRPMGYHELISIFYKKFGTYNPQMTSGKKNNANNYGIAKASESNLPNKSSNYQNNPESTMKYPKSILEFDRGADYGLHPTQKPVALMEYLVRTYSNELETVLDFTMGSGTTGVACAELGRSFIGIELDEGYFNIAKERILGGNK